MVATRGSPKVYGLEHLAIFAQPNKSARVAHRQPPPTLALVNAQLDTEPVGSIARDAPAQAASHVRYDIISAQPDLVWLKRGETLMALVPGETAPGLGMVARIEKRNETWTLIGPNGEELLTENSRSKPPPAPGKGLMLPSD